MTTAEPVTVEGEGAPSPPSTPSHKTIWRLAGPAIMANSAAPLVGLVDTAVMGHLPGPEHLAAIGIGSTFFTIIFWAFGFLRMGTTGLAAQHKGADDRAGLAQLILQASIIAISLSIFIVTLQNPAIAWGLTLLSPPDSVVLHAYDYMSIRIWSAPFTLLGYVLVGVLIGLGRTDQVLILQLTLNLVNLGLNLLFVLGFKMGVAGIALGTLIAEGLMTLMAIAFILKACPLYLIAETAKYGTTWSVTSFGKLTAINGFIFLRTMMLIIALSLITRTAATMGPDILAASQVMLTFTLLISLGLDGVAYAAETLIGQAIGRQNRDEFKRVVWRTFLWAGIMSVLYGLVFLVFGKAIITLLTDLETIRAAVFPLIPFLAVTPLISVASYQFDGIFIGATAARAMAATMAISFAVYLLLLAPLSFQFGLSGLWTCFLIFTGVRGLTQALWMKHLEKRSFQMT